MSGSRIPGFYKLDLQARHDVLKAHFNLSEDDIAVLQASGALDLERADKMVENCIGVFGLPVGLGLNFKINGQDVVVPMVVEEPSVVAAVSNVARLVRDHGGFEAEADRGVMIAQVQILDVDNFENAATTLRAAEAQLLACANAMNPSMSARGGGAHGIEIRTFKAPYPMLVLHLLVDCVDAMGANAVNTMAEGVAPLVEDLTGGRVNLRILSNLADRRLARARCTLPESALAGRGFSGQQAAEGIVQAYRFAAIDPYRAATHNKGIMNGVDAVAIATGNDWRSIEAGAHAYAARGGRYTSLTRWWRDDGSLHGQIELPMATGVVGGSTRVHPTVKVLRKLIAVETARELAMVMAAAGLAQNFGALKALATEGIQRGHMSLHARQAVLSAGITGHLAEVVAKRLVESGDIKEENARVIASSIRGDAQEES